MGEGETGVVTGLEADLIAHVSKQRCFTITFSENVELLRAGAVVRFVASQKVPCVVKIGASLGRVGIKPA